MSVDRRQFLKAGGAATLLAAASGCETVAQHLPIASFTRRRVVVVGGGYGGATAAKYVRLLDPTIEVLLVEPSDEFVSCPLSNLVLGGFRSMADITTPYSGLLRHGVRVIRDTATAIDTERRQVRMALGFWRSCVMN